MLWTDWGDDAPAFDDAGRAWFRAWCERRRGVAELAPTIRGHVLDLLCARAHALVYWLPSDEYRGPDYTNGAWRINEEAWFAALTTCKGLALDAWRLADDAERFPTLDAWLRAEADGLLEHQGATSGRSGLPAEVRKRLSVAARKRRLSWPKRCRSCGESFRPDRSTAKSCPACRAKPRAAKAAKGANPAPIGATDAPLVPLVPRATTVRKRGTTGTNGEKAGTDFATGVADGLREASARLQAILDENMAEIDRHLGRDKP